MAVVADIDGLDLWVEPHHLAAEEEADLQSFIQDHRAKHPLSDSERKAVEDLVRNLRGEKEPTLNRN